MGRPGYQQSPPEWTDPVDDSTYLGVGTPAMKTKEFYRHLPSLEIYLV